MGSSRVEDREIHIEVATVTEAFCAETEGIMDQERQFLAALAKARTFSLSPEKLELRDEGGSLQVQFRPSDP